MGSLCVMVECCSCGNDVVPAKARWSSSASGGAAGAVSVHISCKVGDPTLGLCGMSHGASEDSCTACAFSSQCWRRKLEAANVLVRLVLQLFIHQRVLESRLAQDKLTTGELSVHVVL